MAHQWYIIYTLSGSENRIKHEILERAKKMGLSDLFHDIIIPVVQIPQIKRGKQINIDKKFISGYMLIKMDMTDEGWYLVKNIPKVTCFLGSGDKPKSVSEQEVQNILNQLKSKTQDASAENIYEIGEQIKIIHGPFDSFVGTIEEIDDIKKRVRVSVLILGRSTPLDLCFSQIKKV